MLVAQSLGRFGNYFNHELFGLPTTLPWGLEILPTDPMFPDNTAAGTLSHPLFLYYIISNAASGCDGVESLGSIWCGTASAAVGLSQSGSTPPATCCSASPQTSGRRLSRLRWASCCSCYRNGTIPNLKPQSFEMAARPHPR